MPYIYAMSDIHGYYDIMEQNLEKINLKDKGNILVFAEIILIMVQTAVKFYTG